MRPQSHLSPNSETDYLLILRDNKVGERDVFNEKPTREEQTIASSHEPKSMISNKATKAVVHTTMGDIHMELYPLQAPKAVENFVGHARSSYFEGCIFHRVIKKFVSFPPGYLSPSRKNLTCLMAEDDPDW